MTEFTNDNVSAVCVVPLTFYNIIWKLNLVRTLRDSDEGAEENKEEGNMKKKKPKSKECGDCIYTRYLVFLNAHGRSKF